MDERGATALIGSLRACCLVPLLAFTGCHLLLPHSIASDSRPTAEAHRREARVDTPGAPDEALVDLPSPADRASAERGKDSSADQQREKPKSVDLQLWDSYVWPLCPSCGCGKQCTGDGGPCVCKHFACDFPPTAKQQADCDAITVAEGSTHSCKLGCCTSECL